MTRRIVLGILIALLLVAGAVTVGVYAYQFGIVQGLAQSDKIQVVVPEAGQGLYPSYHYGWGGRFGFHPFGFFGCFGFLVPLLFFFLLFGVVRRMLWGGWGRRGWGHHGWRGEEGVPPPFEEWHRRAHGQSPEAPKSE